jgi:ATP-dependent Lon protease
MATEPARTYPSQLPVLTLRQTVVFPLTLQPLAINRPLSIDSVNRALAGDRLVFLALQNGEHDDPQPDDLRKIGTIAAIRQMAKVPNGGIHVIVEGLARARTDVVTRSGQTMTATVEPLPEVIERSIEVDAYVRRLQELIDRALSVTSGLSQELRGMVAGIDDPLRLAYLLSSLLDMKAEEKQQILEADALIAKLKAVADALNREIALLELKGKIESAAQQEMTDAQRQYFLRQQLKAIQEELGEGEKPEGQEIRKRLADAHLPEDVLAIANREIDRLERMTPASPEYQMIRTYIDWVLDVPWSVMTEDRLDPVAAREALDQDHYDLDKVKDRIVEYLAVQKLKAQQNGTGRIKGPILCFVGPPGVGKTSLGQSIARAMNRKFVRISLGGVRDEAEIRGHRRTYIGAIPGRIVQALKQAGAMNPVFMLDEIDKISVGFQGDPAAALLEVLDPEQNKTFRDNYLDLAFDLSRVLFITTANSLDTIPQALLDRMEILRLSGYSEEEKEQIARRYLIPTQLKTTGLTEDQIEFTDQGLKAIISGYTREAGLRRLERAIARVTRKVTLHLAEAETEKAIVTPETLGDLLGPEIFLPEQMRKTVPAGVVTGLAWTESGGDVLYVESALLPNGKGLTLTGQLGEVMQESVKTAQSYIWAHAADLGVDPEAIKNNGVHVHVPAGAIPKDGPSAGVTMTSAMASLYTGLPARSDIAMTGEVTLAGLVLPIGGVKEKVLAARRAGIQRVILPQGNKKDLRELPDHVRQEMQFHFVGRVEEVLTLAIPGINLRPLALAS